MNKKRFISTHNLANVWFIRDTKDDSLVCIMNRGNRGEEKTKAMLQVMLDALNDTVEKGHQHE